MLTWPREWYKFIQSAFRLETFVLGSRTIYTPRRNERLSYQVWAIDLTLKPEVGPSRWAPYGAFFARLDGESGTFRISDPLRCQPTYNRQRKLPQEPWSDDTFFSDGTGWLNGGYIPPVAEVNGAQPAGSKNIVIRGLPIGLPVALYAGDLIELRPNGMETDTSNLYEIVRQSGTDAEGRAGVEVRPRLRQNFAAGDMVVLHHPLGVFKTTASDQGHVSRDANVGSIGFSAIEHTG